MVTSALTQGSGSFVITLVMVRSVTALYHRLCNHPLPVQLQVLFPGIVTVAVTGSCLALAHSLVGTVNIAQTIAPALSVALGFNIYTTMKLRRMAGSEGEAKAGVP